MKVYTLEQRCSCGWFPGDYHFWQDGTWRILRTIQFNRKSLTHRTFHALSRLVHENKFFRSCTPSKFFEKQFSFVKSKTKLVSFHCRPCFSTLSTGGFSPNHFEWACAWAHVRCRRAMTYLFAFPALLLRAAFSSQRFRKIKYEPAILAFKETAEKGEWSKERNRSCI